MSKKTSLKTKRGAVSLFVTLFTALILSIIVLGFSRLMISEAKQSTNNDLSQSAYDSALAGIEDAKIALLKYHDCLDKGHIGNENANPGSCEYIIWQMQKGIASQNCDTVAKVLNRHKENNGVVIQETKNSTEKGNAKDILQAYTCVTISEELDDYRTTIDQNNRVRIIPIRTAGLKNGVDDIRKIRLGWYSAVNAGKDKISTMTSEHDDDSLPDGSKKMKPPILSVRLLQADKSFSLKELSTAKDTNKSNVGQLLLKPVSGGGKDMILAHELSKSADKSENGLMKVNCRNSQGFFCNLDIDLPKTFNGHDEKNEAASFLVVTLPYGETNTDLSLKLYDENNKQLSFTGVQARIDSTGRANDLYRRIESRIELVDNYFPYPEFAINLNDDGNKSTDKQFWVTEKCWVADEGKKTECNNSNIEEDLSDISDDD